MTTRWLFISLAVLLSACLGSPSSSVEPITVQPGTLNEDWAVDWWLPRHQAKLIEKEERQIDLIMIGDSITHGWEEAGKEVWGEYYGPRNGFNLGFGGDRTENVLWRLRNGEIDGLAPKLVVLMIGTNNTGHRMDPPEDTVLGIEAILSEIHGRLPEAQVLLLGIFPRGVDPTDPGRVNNEKINSILEQTAFKDHVHFRNINSRFLTEDGTLLETVMPDLLHPNKLGYEIWAKAVEDDIDHLMRGP